MAPCRELPPVPVYRFDNDSSGSSIADIPQSTSGVVSKASGGNQDVSSRGMTKTGRVTVDQSDMTGLGHRIGSCLCIGQLRYELSETR